MADVTTERCMEEGKYSYIGNVTVSYCFTKPEWDIWFTGANWCGLDFAGSIWVSPLLGADPCALEEEPLLLIIQHRSYLLIQCSVLSSQWVRTAVFFFCISNRELEQESPSLRWSRSINVYTYCRFLSALSDARLCTTNRWLSVLACEFI